MPEFKKAANLNDLKEGQVKGVKIEGEEIALYLMGGQVFATSDICTHEFCIISDNFDVQGSEVECTCHGSKYNYETGENTAPPSAAPLPTYKTKVENGEIFVEVE